MARSIVLYTLVPSEEEGRRLPRPLVSRVRYGLGNALDQFRWSVGRRFVFKSYRFERFACSNIGDIAVRSAVAQHLSTHLAQDVGVTEVRWGRLTPALVEEINRTASLMVIAGGGYLAADREGNLTPRSQADMALIEQLAVPVVSFGIGLNVNLKDAEQAADPRLSTEAKDSLGRFVSKHALLGVRDPFTQRSLSDASGQDVPIVPDPVFFLDPGPDLRSRQRDAPQARPTIGLNFAFHGPHVGGNLARNLARYIEILGRLREETGCRFVYFPHSDPERLVFRLLRAEGLVSEQANANSPAGLIAEYGKVDLVISEMMHSAIMALSAGTPVISVGYDVKHRALFEMLGLREWLVDPMVDPLDRVMERALELLGDWTAKRELLLRKTKGLEQPFRCFSDDLGGLVKRLELAAAPGTS